MTQQQLQQLAEFNNASFAWWSYNFPNEGCKESRLNAHPNELVDFFEEKRLDGLLRPNRVLMGLNATGEGEHHPFDNMHDFHHPGDQNLKNILQGQNPLHNLLGSYITDLVHDSKNTNAQDVQIEERHVNRLLEEFAILGAESLSLICFNHESFKHIARQLTGLEGNQLETLLGRNRIGINENAEIFPVCGILQAELQGIIHRQLQGRRARFFIVAYRVHHYSLRNVEAATEWLPLELLWLDQNIR